MTLAEIHTLLAYNRELIASTWNFFVSVQLALIGIIFVTRRNEVPVLMRGLLLLPYSAFLDINYRAQVDNYEYSRKVLNYAKELEALSETQSAALSVIFQTGWIIPYLPILYSASFAIGAIIILSDNISALFHRSFAMGQQKKQSKETTGSIADV